MNSFVEAEECFRSSLSLFEKHAASEEVKPMMCRYHPNNDASSRRGIVVTCSAEAVWSCEVKVVAREAPK